MNNEEIRLQKFLSRCGIASRRTSEKYIADGRIQINDKVVTKMGTKVLPSRDTVKFDGKIIRPKKNNITLMLYKPAGYVSTMHDPQGRPCIAQLVPIDKYPSLFPVGRLDRMTKGLLIFTTDGEFGQKLLHPKHEITKTYSVVVEGKFMQGSDEHIKLQSGVEILSGKTHPAKVEILEHFDFDKYLKYEKDFFINSAKKTDIDCLPKDKDLVNKKFTRLSVEIHEGKNRQIRRMFSSVGYEVLLLERKSIGNLKLNNLECGKWAKLTGSDINLMIDR